MYRTRNDIYATQIDTYRTYSVQKVLRCWEPIPGGLYDEYDEIIPSVLSILMDKGGETSSKRLVIDGLMRKFEASVSCFTSDEVRNVTITKLFELDMDNPLSSLNEEELAQIEKNTKLSAFYWLRRNDHADPSDSP